MYFDEREMFELWSRYSSLNKQEIEYFWRKTTEVINGVIYTHRFQKYGCPFEDIQGVAIEAVLAALTRFNPEFINKDGKKTTLFNYISLVAKRSIRFYTIKENKHKTEELFEDVSSKHEDTIDLFSLKQQLDSIINNKYTQEKKYTGYQRKIPPSVKRDLFLKFNEIIIQAISDGEIITKRNLYPLLKKELVKTTKRSLFQTRIRTYVSTIKHGLSSNT